MVKLKLKNSSLELAWVYGLIKKGVLAIKEVDGYEMQKLNAELIRSTWKVVRDELETLPKKQRKNVQIDELVKEIHHQVFELTEDELKEVVKIINDSIDNKLLKKKTNLNKCLKSLVGLLPKSQDK